MELNKIFKTVMIVIMLWHDYVLAQSKELPELKTKQSISNLKFISNDGKFTIFQNRTGGLIYSTNFDNKEIISNEAQTQFEVSSSSARKVLLITSQNNYHKNFNILNSKKIYSVNFDGTKLVEIGNGLNPKLHLDDRWVSFYQPDKKQIIFQSLQIGGLSFNITIKNKISPYFIPQLEMINDNTILFTDVSSLGSQEIYFYDRISKKDESIFKSSRIDTKLEFCLDNDKLILGEFSLNNDNNSKSSISKILTSNILKKQFKLETIYESIKADLGQIYCNFSENKIVFIKNYSEDKAITFNKSEIAELDISNKTLKQLTDLKIVTQIINMDGSFLIPLRGTFLVLKGESNFSVDVLK